VSLWSVWAVPANTKALFLGSACLNENVALSGDFTFDATTEGLEEELAKG
jgi:hypothetical protein